MKDTPEDVRKPPARSAGVPPPIRRSHHPHRGRRGVFWQREYYDHLIRNDEEFERAIRYVAEDPAKANLKHWKWVWVCGRDARTTAVEDGGATKTADYEIFQA